jgi:hypothetical protein
MILPCLSTFPGVERSEDSPDISLRATEEHAATSSSTVVPWTCAYRASVAGLTCEHSPENLFGWFPPADNRYLDVQSIRRHVRGRAREGVSSLFD